MKELIEPCKSCLGCNRLKNPEFTGDKECKFKIFDKISNYPKRENKYLEFIEITEVKEINGKKVEFWRII